MLKYLTVKQNLKQSEYFMDYKQYIAEKLHIEGVSAEEIANQIRQQPTVEVQEMTCFRPPCSQSTERGCQMLLEESWNVAE